jgi:hypothetical protein
MRRRRDAREPRVLVRPAHGWARTWPEWLGDTLAMPMLYLIGFAWAGIVGVSVFGATIKAINTLIMWNV